LLTRGGFANVEGPRWISEENVTKIVKLNILAIALTAVAVSLLWWSARTVFFAGSFLNMSELEIIKSGCHFRLIPPEWLGVDRPDLLFAWLQAECLTRLSLICGGWLLAMIILNRKIRKEIKSNKAVHAIGAAAPQHDG